MNSLLIYYGYRFIDFNYTSRLIFEGIYSIAPEPWHEVFQAVGAVALVWMFLYFLYKNKVFLKV